jgi:DNA-binding transcriptional regulator YdaS (Cro superfamily)
MTPEQALKAAIAIAGGVNSVAKSLGISSAAVSVWRLCPPKRAIEVERLTGGAITRGQLRPDLYPAEAA